MDYESIWSQSEIKIAVRFFKVETRDDIRECLIIILPKMIIVFPTPKTFFKEANL